MRVALPLLLAIASTLAACPPLGDDYEIVDTADAAAGSGGASGGAGGGSGAGGSGAGSGGSAGACDPTSCASTCCGAACVDLMTEPKHCGACDNPCPAGRNCNFGKCGPPGWVAMTKVTGEPSPREMTAHAWTGTHLFIWGGADASGTALDDGALYDPLSGAWAPIAKTVNTPSPRVLATAVVIGQKVVVFGGGDAASTVDYKDGGVYDLTTQSWTALQQSPAEARAPIGRVAGADSVLFWGGFDKAGKPLSGTFVLSVSSGAWTTPSSPTAPPALLHPAWAASDTELFVAGGQPDGAGETDLAWKATLATGIWSAIPKGPSARFGSFGAWEGTRFYVWNGTDGTAIKNDGKLFADNTWVAIDDKGTPPAGRWASHRRSGFAAGIADQRFLIVGGVDVPATTLHKDGGIYDHTTGAWTLIPPWPSGENHEWGASVWTGTELVVWGGRNGAQLTATGERYLPAAP